MARIELEECIKCSISRIFHFNASVTSAQVIALSKKHIIGARL